MKPFLFLLLTSAFILPAASAAVIYSGLQNVPIPLSLPQGQDGVFLNVWTNATANSQPGSFNTAPWMNPFLGGTAFANGNLLCPVIDAPSNPMAPDTIVNLAPGAYIYSGLNFCDGENVSSGHTAGSVTPNKFTLGLPGFLGFKFKPAVSGSAYYGWAQVVFSNTGPGSIIDWAYDDTGDFMFAGSVLPVPEPSRALLVMIGLVGVLTRRRR
ncbi:MAG: PEP-CTERM sorting domain-containing protein [Verrucomicrobia bacterium]|nr:PEP-CTERM sorting domain-containing protein [Verrucomicrobiota bacterium]